MELNVLLFITHLAMCLAFAPRNSFDKEERNLGDCDETANCKTGWLKYNNNCYKIVDEKKTHQEAKDSCAEDDSSLVKIDDVDEGDWIYDTAGLPFVRVTGKGHLEVYWTSGTRSGGCEWVWSDGTALTYKNWDVDEPNNVNGHEDCINISTDGKWNDMSCGEELYYICEKAMEKK